MPELPEVEFARRSLARWFDGRRLVRAEAERRARTFRGGSVADFERLKGTLVRADRRGKYLLLAFSDGRGLLAHLGMTGKLVRRPAGALVKHSRARLVLDSGEVIHFQDPRLFGRLLPVPAPKLDRHPTVQALGRDPVVDGLDPQRLQEAVGGSRQPLKVALMDQARLAGLGNIHAAEALFRARIHPARVPGSLTPEEWLRLCAAIHAGIEFALAAQQVGDDIEYVEEPGADNPFLVYGREGEACRTCGTKVVRFEQGGRSTFACPGCQRPPGRAPGKAAAKRRTDKRRAVKRAVTGRKRART